MLRRLQSFTPNGSCRKLPEARTAARLTVKARTMKIHFFLKMEHLI